MDKSWETGKRDAEFLRDVGSKEMKIVAREWAAKMGWDIMKAESNARAWLYRIRLRLKRCQNYVNQIYALQKSSARIRKLTTSGSLPRSLDDDEAF